MESLCSLNDIEAAIRRLSEKWFGDYVEEMAQEQIAWFRALGRPQYNAQEVKACLQASLDNLALAWKLREFASAWDARDAWGVGAALIVYCAACKGWVKQDKYLLTTGRREAYANGLAIAVPTAPNELGWAMAEQP